MWSLLGLKTGPLLLNVMLGGFLLGVRFISRPILKSKHYDQKVQTNLIIIQLLNTYLMNIFSAFQSMESELRPLRVLTRRGFPQLVK